VSDRRGQAQALTVVAGIVRGREESLRATLEALPDGAASPLAKLPGTHFARFVIAPDLLVRGGMAGANEDDTNHLIFTACLDGELSPWLTALCERIPETADAVFGACEQYPGCGDHAAFARWVADNRLRTAAFTGGYLRAPLAEVREALALRERLRTFAPRAQHMGAAELQAAFLEAFRR
jgi:hypothetical protein